jgi:hypothetical protein
MLTYRRPRNLRFTGLTQNLGQIEGSYRDFQSNCWVNLRILGQPCGFYLRHLHGMRDRYYPDDLPGFQLA